MDIADRRVKVFLTSAAAHVLRVVLTQEIARVERWVLVHGGSAVPTVLRNIQDYLVQARLLQEQVEAAWDAALCSRGRRRQSQHRAGELLRAPE